MNNKLRTAGILMPISALPSEEGIGTLGKQAYCFVDFLKASAQSIWQILPLNPTGYSDSPYQSCSANALNYYFIDLHELVSDGLLKSDEVENAYLGNNERRVDYNRQFIAKTALLKKAFERFDRANKEFIKFIKSGEYHDFALFMSIKENFGYACWTDWDEPLKNYNEEAVKKFEAEHTDELLFWQFTQFKFLEQWNKLKAYANANGISIMGDIPLYVAYDSAEMWKYGDKLFKVDKERRPSCVAGVPPDVFSEDGQLWGNPVYDWKKMKADGYDWWNKRIADCLKLYDILRIDHFRGFDKYFEIPFGDTTARRGVWAEGPSKDLFKDKLDLNIVAEDLGFIDDGVRSLMQYVGYPGMKILQTSFDGHPDNLDKPSNYTENYVCYTGTHDNMTLRQYIEALDSENLEIFIKDLLSECAKAQVLADITDTEAICDTVINLAYSSKARWVILPLWDLLHIGAEARFNFPSTVSDKNWSFRFVKADFSKELSQKLLHFTNLYNRK